MAVKTSRAAKKSKDASPASGAFLPQCKVEKKDLRRWQEKYRRFEKEYKLFRKRNWLAGKVYEKELARLQEELVKLQEWVRQKRLKMAVVFEGRDAAGKGGVIKRITESLNPRICRVVALGVPTERERTQWYFQLRIKP